MKTRQSKTLNLAGTVALGPAALAAVLLVIGSSLRAADAAQPTYTFTTFDVPGAVSFLGGSANYSINNRGEIVGTYTRFAADGVTALEPGFLFEKGTFTDVNIAGAVVTELDCINNEGVSVGDYYLAPYAATKGHFFIRNPDGTIHLLPPVAPNAGFVGNGLALNDGGTIVGAFTLTPEATAWPYGVQGFILKDGEYQVYDYPGAVQTGLIGINNQGTSAGWWEVASSKPHGFLLHKDGTTTPVEVPGAASTLPVTINNQGDLVGFYDDATAGQHGFLLSKGVYTTLDYPGTFGTTQASGINDRGEIVGAYLDANGAFHGFIATPLRPLD